MPIGSCAGFFAFGAIIAMKSIRDGRIGSGLFVTTSSVSVLTALADTIVLTLERSSELNFGSMMRLMLYAADVASKGPHQ